MVPSRTHHGRGVLPGLAGVGDYSTGYLMFRLFLKGVQQYGPFMHTSWAACAPSCPLPADILGEACSKCSQSAHQPCIEPPRQAPRQPGSQSTFQMPIYHAVRFTSILLQFLMLTDRFRARPMGGYSRGQITPIYTWVHPQNMPAA